MVETKKILKNNFRISCEWSTMRQRANVRPAELAVYHREWLMDRLDIHTVRLAINSVAWHGSWLYLVAERQMALQTTTDDDEFH